MLLVKLIRLLGFAALFTVLSQMSAATIIHVPTDQPTIQAGMAAALTGDTVQIADGTYSGPGNRDLMAGGKVLTVRGVGEVIIDCADIGAHAGFSLRLPTDTVTLENLSVTNATDTIGAVRIDFGDVYIRNCRIYGNQTDGVRVTRQGRVTIDSSLIYDNSGRGVYVGDMVVPWGTLTARWTTIAGNGEDGIYLKAFESVTIQNCTVAMNDLTGIFSEGDPPKNATFMDLLIERCLIWQNGDVGIGRAFIQNDPTLLCNNSFGNGGLGDFYNIPNFGGDTHGNISQDPLIATTNPWPSFTPSGTSPCAPANNSCGVLMGAWSAGPLVCECWTGATGDINRNGETNLTDLTLLVNHIFVTFAPLACPPTANVTGDQACDINLTDLTNLVNHLFITFDPTADLGDFDDCLCY